MMKTKVAPFHLGHGVVVLSWDITGRKLQSVCFVECIAKQFCCVLLH